MANLASITDASFQPEVLGHDGPVVVDFWAEWCGPCKTLGPLLEQAAATVPGVKVVKLNIDENMESPVTYGVRGIPTLIAFKGGQPVANLVGVRSPEELTSWLKDLTA
jgi:thioredoxin 1